MSKEITIKWKMEDEQDQLDYLQALKGPNAMISLHDIAEQIFRPARKHGYPDSSIEEAYNKCTPSDNEQDDHAGDLIYLLERKFYEILESNDVNLSKLY